MEKSNLLIYGLFIAAYLLFNFLMQQLAAKRARQQRERVQQEQAQQDASMTSADEPLDELWGRGGQHEEAREPVVTVEPARRRVETIGGTAAPRLSPKALLRSRQSLRDAIVVMTVLGPCRALDPHDRG
jgi:hypothetical protein